MKSALAQPRVLPRECATADASNRVRSLRDASTREDEGRLAPQGRKQFAGHPVSSSRANIPTTLGTVSPQRGPIPSVRAVGIQPAAHHLFSSSIESASHSTSDENSNALVGKMFRAKTLVKSEIFKVKSERRRLARTAFRYIAAEAAKGDSAVQIAAETGIAVSEIYEYRTAKRQPNLDAWYALIDRRPDLKPMVDQITSGQATPEQINKLILFFQGRGSG